MSFWISGWGTQGRCRYSAVSLITRFDFMAPVTRVITALQCIWKLKFIPGQGKVKEFCGWPGKFRKDLESQRKVREFENKWLWQAVLENLFFLSKRGKGVLSHEIV